MCRGHGPKKTAGVSGPSTLGAVVDDDGREPQVRFAPFLGSLAAL